MPPEPDPPYPERRDLGQARPEAAETPLPTILPPNIRAWRARLAARPPAHLSAAGVSVVVSHSGGGLPRILHWGADLGEISDNGLRELERATSRGTGPNEIDTEIPVAVLPEHSRGWNGRPGLAGHRDGRDWSARFELIGWELTGRGHDGPCQRLVATAIDQAAGLRLRWELELLRSGLLRCRAALTVEDDASGQYVVDGLALTVPVPTVATELLDLTGRWARERSPQRAPFLVGAHLRDNRRGRTGADAPLILAAGTPGFGFATGEVWAVHTAWSGNHRTYAEKVASGMAVLGGGELLLPGEIRLAAGQTYRSPWLYGGYGCGLDEMAARFHGFLRARVNHPVHPRPVVINTWEAVGFDHDLARLTELARRGAEVGAERFVLDDGWFSGRRHDRAGLGDWVVDKSVWPDGLGPLIEVVTGLGMDFGLWMEPEMINPDSDLARAHPDWMLATGGRLPPTSRHQQVLDLGNPDAYEHVLERVDSLLDEYDIAYLKWDHNRDLVDAGHPPGGEAGVHAQTTATYQLIDELKARHPEVEIESCSSGGLRVDLGIIARTDRVWGSDCLDALERQRIHRWTTQVIPPELVGAHVGSSPDLITGRRLELSFRAGTAVFGSFGIEWDLTRLAAEELAELGEWVRFYRENRHLLHAGRVVRADRQDSLWLHGVVAPDRSDALFALVSETTAVTTYAGAVRFPWLDPDRTYHLAPQPPGDRPAMLNPRPPGWLDGGVTLPGSALAAVGVQAPILRPEQLLLIRARAV